MVHMKLTWVCVLATALVGAACGGDDDDDVRGEDAGGDGGHGDHEDSGKPVDDDDAGSKPALSFFVSSDTSKTGNLGGLKGADERCAKLAKAAGSTRKFQAYLSAEKTSASDDKPVHARDRIGKGPWFNAIGVMLAKDVTALHAIKSGDAALFLTEKGGRINGQWEGSPTPNEHDVLTGSDAEGKVLTGKTCKDWTSEESGIFAQVGHSDGLGPMRNPNPPYASWNS